MRPELNSESEGSLRPSLISSIHRPFQSVRVRRVLRALRAPLGVLGLAVLIPFIKPEWFVAGLAVSMAGEAVQVWSFASLSKKKTLATKGPYALVRNPMYLGRYLLTLGGILLTGYLPLVAIYTVGYYLYALNRVRREEVALAEIFGDSYREYCATTNRFLPSPRKLTSADVWYARWALFVQNHGPLNLLLAVAAWGLLYWFTFVYQIGGATATAQAARWCGLS